MQSIQFLKTTDPAKKTIGILAAFFQSRTDISLLVNALLKEHNVVIFCSPANEPYVRQIFGESVSIRVTRERSNSFFNYVWERIYLLLKKKPKSRVNYFLMEYFKASNLKTKAARKKAKRIIMLQRLLPSIVSYDTYISKLRPTGSTDISDIDKFITFTECPDDYMIARIYSSKLPMKVYVYSWDHACKQTRFPSWADYYVWNEEIKSDLSNLQGISPNKIHISGSTQFAYILQYKALSTRPTPTYPYVIFACSIGITDLISQEIEAAEMLASILQREKPDWKLIVRPYPHVADWSVYKNLERAGNVILDDSYKNADNIVNPGSYIEKYDLISNAHAVFHVGSTIGLEACFFKTPVYVLDVFQDNKQSLSMYHFVHQYQNDKYFNARFSQNVITDFNQLSKVLNSNLVVNGMEPNTIIPNEFPLRTIDDIATTFTC